MGASVAIPAVLGAVGLYQQGQQAKAQQKVQKQALKATDAQAANVNAINELAAGYDPAAATKAAIETASNTAGATLEKALRGLKVNYGAANANGDTEFNVQAQRTTNDVLDPLKTWAANEAASGTFRKAQILSMANGPAGDVANNYFRAASIMPTTDPAGSLNLLATALGRIKGAGGRGDAFSNVNPETMVGLPGSQYTSTGGFTLP